LARYVKVDMSRLRVIGDDILGIPVGWPTNHVAGLMEACRIVGSESCRCCWSRMLPETGWLEAAQSASSIPQSLTVYWSDVDLLSGWVFVQSRVTAWGRNAWR
jgi:hypothetical protein